MLPGNNRGCARTDCARCHLTNNESRPTSKQRDGICVVSGLHVISENQREGFPSCDNAFRTYCSSGFFPSGCCIVVSHWMCNRSNKAFICRDAPLFVRLITETYQTNDGKLPEFSAYLFFTMTNAKSSFLEFLLKSDKKYIRDIFLYKIYKNFFPINKYKRKFLLIYICLSTWW